MLRAPCFDLAELNLIFHGRLSSLDGFCCWSEVSSAIRTWVIIMWVKLFEDFEQGHDSGRGVDAQLSVCLQRLLIMKLLVSGRVLVRRLSKNPETPFF